MGTRSANKYSVKQTRQIRQESPLGADYGLIIKRCWTEKCHFSNRVIISTMWLLWLVGNLLWSEVLELLPHPRSSPPHLPRRRERNKEGPAACLSSCTHMYTNDDGSQSFEGCHRSWYLHTKMCQAARCWFPSSHLWRTQFPLNIAAVLPCD